MDIGTPAEKLNFVMCMGCVMFIMFGYLFWNVKSI